MGKRRSVRHLRIGRSVYRMSKLKRFASKNRIWIFGILYLAQLCTGIWLVLKVRRLDLLPATYLSGLTAGLLILAFLSGIFLFADLQIRSRKAKHGLLLAGVIGSLCVTALSGAGAVIVGQVQDVFDDIVMEEEPEYAAVAGVYVRAEDPAQELKDAAGYRIGIMEQLDAAVTDCALRQAEETLGSIETIAYPSTPELFAALYGGDIDAVLVNDAYLSIMDDDDELKDYDSRTRCIAEITIRDADLAAAGNQEPVTAEVTAAEEQPEEEISLPRPFVVYISGSDSRKKEIITASRNDVNILMVINPESHQILLVNTPRDYYVENPLGNGALDKLTHCGLGGVQNSMGALERLYQQKVDYFIRINFTGFETLVDAIGGITVESSMEFDAWTNKNVHILEGENKLNGKQALAFARERYAFARGDNERGQNQMKVITAIVDKVTHSGVSLLANYSGILDSLRGMFTTSIPASAISALMKYQLEEMPSWSMRSFAVIGTGATNTTYSAPGSYVYVMNRNEIYTTYASELISRVLEGDRLTEADLEIDEEVTARIQAELDAKKAEAGETAGVSGGQTYPTYASKARPASRKTGRGVRPSKGMAAQ